MSPQVDPYIFIGINRSHDASIPNFLCGSVGSLHICILIFCHWFGFISYSFILFPDHKPCPNSSIITSPELCVNTLTPVHIGILT